MARFLFGLTIILLLLILPFIILIRGSVFFHEQYQQAPWVCILAGMSGSILVLSIYLHYANYRIRNRTGDFGNGRQLHMFSIALVCAYCLPGLFYFSAANAKYSEVQEEFVSLHPILRLGISTLVWLDSDLIITDANRLPDDYRRMGLATKNSSLHYQQSNGYAHAVDIRTIGHTELRNDLVETYFRMMGFNTLRHVGTADHLHVSLSSHDRPGGI